MPVEIAVQDHAGATAAAQGGADRLEVCSALSLGGLTPSLGTIEACLTVGLPALPLIRPRPGDFTYDPEEIAVACRDIESAMKAGAAGVVVGALANGRLDRTTLTSWANAALSITPSAEIVIHRCVDVLQDQGVSAEELADMCEGLPITRILTSGGAPTVPEGLGQLSQLREALEHRGITVQAGGGLTLDSIPKLVSLGITDIHLSASEQAPTGPAGPGGGPATVTRTSQEIVAGTVSALRAAQALHH